MLTLGIITLFRSYLNRKLKDPLQTAPVRRPLCYDNYYFL